MKIELVGCADTALSGAVSTGLNLGCEVSAECPCALESLKRGDAVTVCHEKFEMKLLVDDFRVGRGSTRLHAVDSVRFAARYELQSFSGEQGSSLGRAIEARVALKAAPTELYRMVPAVQVDASVSDLLTDAAARLACSWWFGDGGLHLAPIDSSPLVVAGEALERVPQGHWVSFGLDEELPWPGRSLKCGGVEGAVLQVSYECRGDLVTGRALVGEAVPCKRKQRRASVFLACKVAALNPLLVDYVDPDGRVVRTQATCVAPTGLGGEFRIDYPIRVGDQGYLQLDVGGVNTAAPLFHPWGPTVPSEVYQVRAVKGKNEMQQQSNVIKKVEYNTERFEIQS